MKYVVGKSKSDKCFWCCFYGTSDREKKPHGNSKMVNCVLLWEWKDFEYYNLWIAIEQCLDFPRKMVTTICCWSTKYIESRCSRFCTVGRIHNSWMENPFIECINFWYSSGLLSRTRVERQGYKACFLRFDTAVHRWQGSVHCGHNRYASHFSRTLLQVHVGYHVCNVLHFANALR